MRERRPWRGFAAPALVAILFTAAGAGAQPLTIPRFDFSFSNPGARSLGFGGAFAALADDATAAYANPAGLVQLTEPEVSVETRLWKRSPSFIAGGRAEGEPTGIGLDTHDGIVFARDHSRETGPSFAAVVIPRGRWSFALYGHQLAKFQERAESQGFFIEGDFFFGSRFPAERETVDLGVTTAGMAAAWRMNDRLSFGLGLVFSDASLKTASEGFLPDDDSLQALFGRISFLPQRRISTSTLTIEGTDLTVNAGVLGRLSDQVSGGLFYRQGAKIEGTADFATGPGAPFDLSFRTKAELHVPDVAGGGLAYRSKNGRLTIATEVDHVGYSDLVKVLDTEDVSVIGRTYQDAWEYHLGAEVALLQSTPILAFRAGTWIEANGDQLGKKDFSHLAAGLGVAAQPFQIDLAGDLSDEGNTVSLSCIYTF